MNVDDAAAHVRHLWDLLRKLITEHPTQPRTVETKAAAMVGRCIEDIRDQLQFARYRDLYERLKCEPLCSGIDRAVKDAGIASLLWEMIDRRPALGISSPRVETRQEYHFRMIASKAQKARENRGSQNSAA